MLDVDIAVPMESGSELLVRLKEAVASSVPMAVVGTSRKNTSGFFVSGSLSPEQHQRVMGTIQEFCGKNNLDWAQLESRPKGATYPLPLSETADAYEGGRTSGRLEDLAAEEDRLARKLGLRSAPQ